MHAQVQQWIHALLRYLRGWRRMPAAAAARVRPWQAVIGSTLRRCQTYNDNQCSGDIIITPPSYSDRNWQTPAPGTPYYFDSYQTFYTLQVRRRGAGNVRWLTTRGRAICRWSMPTRRCRPPL